ncbi:beta-hexosaminidase [Drepanopeziza brunnea f. sp. 'multigermtubi' MB_m1]|uniref:beta-N-acetylhexosaminidase n=1 Tax=Marssonina brunnea f. sp. multigermtubi (strain MB_m1) TaxID=1072389 RepID=K1W873_MARBU|nr:beta-hexosaminidase [Drepanopeziza brunnea f. sp. 'multigermtubi' MB_m1]EKD13370.1 beta-hexosaminidase [Drepanopeziza brunnea f. sp. 'multigermtubi' MB_m1]
MKLFSGGLLAFFSSNLDTAARWVGIPTVTFEGSASKYSFSLKKLQSVVFDKNNKNAVNTKGDNLLPPTPRSFSNSFRANLLSSLDLAVPVLTGTSAARDSTFLSIGNLGEYLNAAGSTILEGYEVLHQSDRQRDCDHGAKSAWCLVGDNLDSTKRCLEPELRSGSAVDTPGFGGTRISGGIFRGHEVLDAAKHHYPPDFILEMCSYVSFFKQKKLHLHLSDSPTVNPELTKKEKLDFYSAFHLDFPDPAVTGLNKRVNESYDQADLERRQQT